MFPSRVTANELLWRNPVSVEFFVDFETVSDLDDDLSQFPEAGGHPLLFMTGCGHSTGAIDAPRWTCEVFTTQRLTLAEERRIIEEWLDHMHHVCEQLGSSLDQARLFHWSPAEPSSLSDAYNAAAIRQQATDWPQLPWVDLLNQVIRKQPVTVRGAFGFGLKSVAKALHSHGLIETLWGDGPTDGLGAMVGAWWCNSEAERLGKSMSELELMKEIESYNEVDCKVMAEVLGYLRNQGTPFKSIISSRKNRLQKTSSSTRWRRP